MGPRMPVIYSELDNLRNDGGMWKYARVVAWQKIRHTSAIFVLSVLALAFGFLSPWAYFSAATLFAVVTYIACTQVLMAPRDQLIAARWERDRLRLKLHPKGPYSTARWLLDRYVRSGKKLRKQLDSRFSRKRQGALSGVGSWDTGFRNDFDVINRQCGRADGPNFGEPFHRYPSSSLTGVKEWLDNQIAKMEMTLQRGE
jgi:hypothetical protein